MRTDGIWFRDEAGRTLILRGANLGGSTKMPTRPNGATYRREGFFDHRDVSFVGRPFPLDEADEHFRNEYLKPFALRFTGAVTLAGLLAALHVTGTPLDEQRIIMFGAGSAAMGIANQIVTAMHSAGMTEEQARATIWLVDSRGLVHSDRTTLDRFKQEYARPQEQVVDWQTDESRSIPLLEAVRQVHPTVLIGTAAQPGAFTEEIVREMAQHCARPIIFPLSNPTSKSEAVPAALIAWTEGRALVATGSPFAPVRNDGRTIQIGQCNNAFIFPGVGLGVIATKARQVTDAMFVAAARGLGELSPARRDPTASLFPALEDVRAVSQQVALAVGAEAQRAGLAEATTPEELERRVMAHMWTPRYRRLKASGGSEANARRGSVD